MKILVSAYACEPEKGSEPGVGWNWVKQIARFHEVWVITRSNNRMVIDKMLIKEPMSNVHWVYFDLPAWACFWKKGQRGVHLYYYLWQMGAYSVVKKLHCNIVFDIIHHVTFVRYWMPCFLSLLPIPFIWGPIGGGESTPKTFWPTFGNNGKMYEKVRTIARWIGERDPFVILTARKSKKILVTTKETMDRVRRLTEGNIRIVGESGLSNEDINKLGDSDAEHSKVIKFISIGRLLHWKGFHFGIEAFALSNLINAEYWIIGNGPERGRLEALSYRLNIDRRVHFLEELSREDTLTKLKECHILVHPSLHDSGGWVCLESMAAGKPVICLNIGGPSLQVTKDTGFIIPAINPNQVVEEMVQAMIKLARDLDLRQYMGEAARQRVQNHFNWDEKGEHLMALYEEVIGQCLD